MGPQLPKHWGCPSTHHTTRRGMDCMLPGGGDPHVGVGEEPVVHTAVCVPGVGGGGLGAAGNTWLACSVYTWCLKPPVRETSIPGLGQHGGASELGPPPGIADTGAWRLEFQRLGAGFAHSALQ